MKFFNAALLLFAGAQAIKLMDSAAGSGTAASGTGSASGSGTAAASGTAAGSGTDSAPTVVGEP